ncbi:hypothetical protein J2X97_001409 [Epilithonimonas hungarica]|uniref:hypothetical protein n=1 Tax=Epilithonimonas hungarica TaxID=454006 RepID=UPI0027871008|nr:hypothetical protein [Epilithonimonas hungarica]MDP9955772.1 hypothetical protein [Epilithonimonas hungarica]
MMNIKTLLFAPVLLLMSNCTTQSQTQNSENGSNTITIGINKTAKIPNSKINLHFKEITEDSRCPVDVTCVWEGIATVNIEGTSGSQKTNFQVGTRDFLPRNVSKSFSFSGYRFTLTDLKPYPGGKQESESVTFKYEKEE